MSFKHGRQLNSTVSNHANNMIFGRMLRRFWKYLFHMQYEHERVEITYQYSNFKHSQLKVESSSKNCIIVHLFLYTRQAIEFDSTKSCSTITKSAEFPHMEHIARNAANHLTPKTYGLQYNFA